MIFLKALVCAVVICLLGTFIRGFLWKKFTFTFSEILPFLLAFISLLTFLFIKILPFHPIWLTIPIATQVLLTAFANAFGDMRESFLLEEQRKVEKSMQTPLRSNEKSDGKVDMKADLKENMKENHIDVDEVYQEENQSENIVSKKEEELSENDKKIGDNVTSTLDIKADIRDNVSSITVNSYSDEEDFHMYDENKKNVEILFLQADIFLVQGDIEKNKQLLFYINNKYENTSIGNRAQEELIKLYGKEIFLKER